MEEFALIKSRVNLNRVNLGFALIPDLKVYQFQQAYMHVQMRSKAAKCSVIYVYL